MFLVGRVNATVSGLDTGYGYSTRFRTEGGRVCSPFRVRKNRLLAAPINTVD
jgi:hypothetical protein